MKVLVQRVSRAEVRVDGETKASIGRGVLVLLGIERTDSEEHAC
ncbi:MAG TPA: D-tyrosyl-tRNA(Tyr) deacylase, partial [Acidobacteria bacterium]|nr:D-tyrosyl-tRNA(Tyr) deacylase [Acidobacteriota bacterium]